VGVALAGAGVHAQSREASQPRRPADELQMRYQIGVMERVLEQAVQHGAQKIGRVLQAVSPDLVIFTGPPRARGFRLQDYGYFFDVDVPALRRSLMWSVRTLNSERSALGRDLESLRRFVSSVQNESARDSLERALRRIELQVGPVAATSTSAPSISVPEVEGVGAAAAILDDPGETYTTEVKDALIEAMLDHSGSVPLGPDEWLTVAARDNEVTLGADMGDVLTIVLRIKGSDLAAFRTARVGREEARKRVEVRQF
jgi:hypothetical protein